MQNQQKEIDLGYGLGLRQKHVKQIILQRPKEVEWFEIISENYFNPLSEKRGQIDDLRQDYPFVMHGVSMSIGSTDELDTEYLSNLKSLAEWLKPEIISDHICWTGINNFNSHDLLPVPYTEESLKNMIRKISQTQDFLGRRIALENPSTYLEFNGSTLNEWDYIRYVAEEADCDLLLDVNNVYVNCYNHGYDAKEYISSLPKDRVVQIHLAGHKNCGTHIIDTHSDHVNEEVLKLYEHSLNIMGKRNTMIEWDAEIPEFDVLLNELKKVKKIEINRSLPKNTDKPKYIKNDPDPEKLEDLYNKFQFNLLNLREFKTKPGEWVKKKDKLSQQDQMYIYSSAYRTRLFNLISEEYMATKKYVGENNFNMLVRSYIEYQPSKYKNIDDYIANLPAFSSRYTDNITQELIYLESEIFRLQEVNYGVLGSSRTLKFNNDVNSLYTACYKDEIEKLDPQDINGRQTFLLISKEEDGVYREEISKQRFHELEKMLS